MKLKRNELKLYLLIWMNFKNIVLREENKLLKKFDSIILYILILKI